MNLVSFHVGAATNPMTVSVFAQDEETALRMLNRVVALGPPKAPDPADRVARLRVSEHGQIISFLEILRTKPDAIRVFVYPVEQGSYICSVAPDRGALTCEQLNEQG